MYCATETNNVFHVFDEICYDFLILAKKSSDTISK